MALGRSYGKRILEHVGANAGRLTDAEVSSRRCGGGRQIRGDPRPRRSGTQRATVDLMPRDIALAGTAVVLFVDDLQWAGRSPLAVVDLCMSEQNAGAGLLLAGGLP